MREPDVESERKDELWRRQRGGGSGNGGSLSRERKRRPRQAISRWRLGIVRLKRLEGRWDGDVRGGQAGVLVWGQDGIISRVVGGGGKSVCEKDLGKVRVLPVRVHELLSRCTGRWELRQVRV